MVRAPAIQTHLWFLSRLKWAMLFSDLLPKPALSKRSQSSMALPRFQSRHPQKTSSASKDEYSLLSVVILWLPSNFRGILKKKKNSHLQVFASSVVGVRLQEKVEEAGTEETALFKALCTMVLMDSLSVRTRALWKTTFSHVCNPWEFLIAVIQRKIFQRSVNKKAFNIIFLTAKSVSHSLLHSHCSPWF